MNARDEHAFMIHLAESVLRMPARSDRRQEAYDDAYWTVMEGKDCAFYPAREWRTAVDSPEYDAEQEIPLFLAIKLAASLIGASDADRWRVVENALRAEAERYAEYHADIAHAEGR